MTFQESKALSIAGFLEKYHQEPSKIRGQNFWYHSPLHAERTPSFKVDIRLNLWYDHGLGKGGTLIDLGCELWQCSPKEVLEKLQEMPVWKAPVSLPTQATNPPPGIQIISAVPLWDPRLLAYAESRRIDPAILKIYCQQVAYQIRDQRYRAIGFKNEAGGYELRSAYFKGSSSPKSFTHLRAGKAQLMVLEGFMDFLSLGSYLPVLPFDILVLNSLALLEKARPVLESYPSLILLLDQDAAGEKATRHLLASYPFALDARCLLGNAKDVNEALIKFSLLHI